MITVNLSNAELQKAFKNIEKYKASVKQGVRKEIKRAAFSVVNNAKKNLRQNNSWKTGNLAAKLVVKGDLTQLEAKAGTDVNYAAYVEMGTPPHIIQVKTKKVLARYTRTSKGKAEFQVFGKKVNHPGSKAKPFLSPAAESERPVYVKNMVKILSNET